MFCTFLIYWEQPKADGDKKVGLQRGGQFLKNFQELSKNPRKIP